MKAGRLQVPARGLPSIKPLAEALIVRLESLENRLAAMKQAPGSTPLRPVPLAQERVLLRQLEVRTADSVTLEQQRVRDRALDEEYFRREMVAAQVYYENGAADAKSTNAIVMSAPATAAGTNPMIHSMVLARDLWPRTRPRLTMWYTAPAGSTNTFNLRFQLVPFPVGTTTANAALFSMTFTPAGPAVAGTIQTATIVGSAVMPAIAGPVRLSIVRIGGDANANALHILLALVTFEEVA